VSAYKTDKHVESEDGCPRFEGKLDRRMADPIDGRFTLTIPSEEKNYRTQYCKSGYHPRGFTSNDNSSSGTPVTRITIRLIKNGGTHRQAIALLHRDAQDAVLRLSAIDKERFKAAMLQLAPPERRLVMELALAQVRPTRYEDPKDSKDIDIHQGLETVLAALRSDLQYFWAANPQEFAEAVRDFGDFQRYVDERKLRTDTPPE
jgi:hypothetical protein